MKRNAMVVGKVLVTILTREEVRDVYQYAFS